MNLKDLITTISNSSHNDWHEVSREANFFKYQLVENGNKLEIECHQILKTYKKDVSITIAFGLSNNQDKYLDIFYNNALVFRTSYRDKILGSGREISLPIPNTQGEIPKDYYNIIRLISNPKEDYNFHLDGTMVEKEWI